MIEPTEEKERDASDEFIIHAKKATELLQMSHTVHELESDGKLGRDESVKLAVDLNRRAITETNAALEAMKKQQSRLNPKH